MQPSSRATFSLRAGDLGRMLVAWAVSTASLAIAAELLPGLDAETLWSFAAVALVSALAGQALVMQLALVVVPGVDSTSFFTTLAAAWISAAVTTVLVWFTTAGTPESLPVADGAAG